MNTQTAKHLVMVTAAYSSVASDHVKQCHQLAKASASSYANVQIQLEQRPSAYPYRV